MARVEVPYEHDPANLTTIYLAATSSTVEPSPDADVWVPAYRDTVDGRRVVYADLPPGRRVWARIGQRVKSLGNRR